MTKFEKYEIDPPTNVVETSTSSHPDDVSKTNIRIRAIVNNNVSQGEIDRIEFIINVPKASEADFTISNSVDSIKTELDDGQLENLSNEFPENKPKLSSEASVTVIVPGAKWRINDSGNVYLILSEVDENKPLILNIFGPYGDNDLLTKSPQAITPVAEAFGRWTLARPGDVDVFVATPNVAQEQETSKTTESIPLLVDQEDGDLIFHLYDVEVVEKTGITTIDVVEYQNGKPVLIDPPLEIRKIKSNLRIDYFKATDTDGNTNSNVVTHGTQVRLSWATTSATTVDLQGPNLEGVEDVPRNSTDRDLHDSFIDITPQTTSTYTLTARSADEIDAVATQQLTITVTDQIKIPKIVGEANNLILSAENVRVESEANDSTFHANTIEAANTITAARFEGQGIVPLGTIIAWTGPTITELVNRDPGIVQRDPNNNKRILSVDYSNISLSDFVPKGWVLCDGNNNEPIICADNQERLVPNLTGRFIIGSGKYVAQEKTIGRKTKEHIEFYKFGSTGGNTQIFLARQNLPDHKHRISRVTEGSQFPSATGNNLMLSKDRAGLKLEVETDSFFQDDGTVLSVDSDEMGVPFPIVSPYFVLSYIMYTGTS